MRISSLKQRKRKRKLRVFLCVVILSFYLLNISIFIPTLIIILFELRNEIIQLYRRISGKTLFDGYDKLFIEHTKNIKTYGEYGVGNSTVWMYQNTNAKILSVDTSKEWINIVKSKMNDLDRIQLNWVDLGKLVDWGTPASYEKRDYIKSYLESIWTNNNKPELILVDGRFRVACFLYSLLKANPGSKIIFDDYNNRLHYHIIEEFIKPTEVYKNQGLFIVPENLPIDKIEKTITDFIHVLD